VDYLQEARLIITAYEIWTVTSLDLSLCNLSLCPNFVSCYYKPSSADYYSLKLCISLHFREAKVLPESLGTKGCADLQTLVKAERSWKRAQCVA